MSKKPKKQNQSRNQQGNGFGKLNAGAPGTPKTPEKQIKDTPEHKVKDLITAAEANVIEQDIEVLISEPVKVESAIDELLQKGSEALKLLEIQRARLESKEQEIENSATQLHQAQSDLKKRIIEFECQLAPFEKKKADVDKREQELLGREEQVLLREMDADAGFAKRNREALEKLATESASLQERFSEHRTLMVSERDSFESEKHVFRQQMLLEFEHSRTLLQQEIETEREKLSTLKNEQKDEMERLAADIKEKAAGIRKKEKEINLEREMLIEERDSLDSRIELLAARKLEEKDSLIAALEERLDSARQERARLEKSLCDREEADQRFGNRTPDEILHEIQQLRSVKKKLQEDLNSRPNVDAVQRLAELEREREAWESERLELKAEISDIKHDLNRKRIAVTELETLRNHKAALEASNELLSKALEEEIRKVQDQIRSKDGKSAFISCAAMDTDSEHQHSPDLQNDINDLKSFAEEIRHRMALDPMTDKKLFYTASDVRSLIAGLATSRLHLLQGISGTGKTSLPLAFARAIGAGSKVVEVQAGWRDRQDLIGHFNAFEGRFHETEFLLSLYKAHCPFYKNRPFIVVLDEMNLSHPEQYFADLLSALEQDMHRRELVLMSAAVEAPPKWFKEGRILPLPNNVWFVGTANHDETTKDFADKTYDRAHVMELPRHREEFPIKELPLAAPISMEALQDSFDDAMEKHSKAYKEAYSFLETRLGDHLSQKFRLGWGNRLERQMESYIPVVIATGGSVGEATDYILASKLLRKIRDRQENRPADILALRDLIRSEWGQLDKNNGPVKSMGIIREELHRLGQDEE